MDNELRLPSAGLSDDVVTVRHLADRDAEAFAAGTKDPLVERYAHLPEPNYTPETVREQLAGVIEQGLAERSLAVLAIAAADDDRFLGVLTLFGFDWDAGTVEVGFWLTPAARGLGAASRAVELAAGWVGDLGLGALTARTDAANEASGRVLKRAGFVQVGVPTEDRAPSGHVITAVAYRRDLAG